MGEHAADLNDKPCHHSHQGRETEICRTGDDDFIAPHRFALPGLAPCIVQYPHQSCCASRGHRHPFQASRLKRFRPRTDSARVAGENDRGYPLLYGQEGGNLSLPPALRHQRGKRLPRMEAAGNFRGIEVKNIAFLPSQAAVDFLKCLSQDPVFASIVVFDGLAEGEEGLRETQITEESAEFSLAYPLRLQAAANIAFSVAASALLCLKIQCSADVPTPPDHAASARCFGGLPTIAASKSPAHWVNCAHTRVGMLPA